MVVGEILRADMLKLRCGIFLAKRDRRHILFKVNRRKTRSVGDLRSAQPRKMAIFRRLSFNKSFYKLQTSVKMSTLLLQRI